MRLHTMGRSIYSHVLAAEEDDLVVLMRKEGAAIFLYCTYIQILFRVYFVFFMMPAFFCLPMSAVC